MAYLVKQTHVLDELALAIQNDLGSRSTNRTYTFEMFGYDSEKTAASSNAVCEGRDTIGSDFSEIGLFEITDLVVKLHDLMEARTAVGWTSMALTMDADGKATAKFHYPDARAE